MSLQPADALWEFRTIWRDTRDFNICENVTHWRTLTSGYDDTDAAFTNWVNQWITEILPRIENCLSDTTFLHEVQGQFRLPSVQFLHKKVFADGDHVGAIDHLAFPDSNPVQAAACLTRYTFRPGRHGIGRYFHGPLHSLYQSNGVLDPAPIGAPNLSDLSDALGDPLTANLIEFHPVVTGRTNPTFDSTCDIRLQVFAPLVSYMKSRRVGVGV